MRFLFILFVLFPLRIETTLATSARFDDPLPQFAEGELFQERRTYYQLQDNYKDTTKAYALECAAEHGLKTPQRYDPNCKDETLLAEYTELLDQKVHQAFDEMPFNLNVEDLIDRCGIALYFFPEVMPFVYGKRLLLERGHIEPENPAYVAVSNFSYQVRVLLKKLWPNVLHHCGYGLVDLEQGTSRTTLQQGDLFCMLDPLKGEAPVWGLYVGSNAREHPMVMIRQEGSISESYKNKVVEWGKGTANATHTLVYRKGYQGFVPLGDKNIEDLETLLQDRMPKTTPIPNLTESDVPSENPKVPEFCSWGVQSDQDWQSEFLKLEEVGGQLADVLKRYRVPIPYNQALSAPVDNPELLKDMTDRFDIGCLYDLHGQRCDDYWENQFGSKDSCLFAPYHNCEINDPLYPCFFCANHQKTVTRLDEGTYFLSHTIERLIPKGSNTEDATTLNRRLAVAIKHAWPLVVLDKHSDTRFKTEEEKPTWTNTAKKTSLLHIFDSAGKSLHWAAYAGFDKDSFEPIVMIRQPNGDDTYHNELRYLSGVEDAHEMQLFRRKAGASNGYSLTCYALPVFEY